MEDAFMALEFFKNIHDMIFRTMHRIPRTVESKDDNGSKVLNISETKYFKNFINTKFNKNVFHEKME